MAIDISIIVPVYNVERYLESSLTSLIDQSFTNFEVLCIDDGSTDGSLEILRKFQAKDKRFKILTQSNMGAGSARNLGIKSAKGKYILFVDSDDQLESDALQTCYQELVANDLDVLLFDARSEFLSSELEEKFSWYKTAYIRSKEYKEIVAGEDMFNLMMSVSDYIVSSCMYMFSRKVILCNNLLFETGIVYEDNIFTLKLLMYAKRVKHLKKQLYIRLVRDNSIVTKGITEKNLYSYCRCFSEIYIFAKENITNPLTQKNITILLNSIKKHITNQANLLKQNISDDSFSYIDRYLINYFATQQPNDKGRFYKKQVGNLFIKTIHSLESEGLLLTLNKVFRHCRKYF